MTKKYVRMSGLGGQGVVTAASILGSAAILDGKNVIANPFFGAEKRLAPAESYVRIADEKLFDSGEILYPDIIMVFHPDVILQGKSYTMPFFFGIKEDGVIVVNSATELKFTDDESRRLAELNVSVHFFPATDTAREIAGTELATNVAMLGALLGVTGLVSFDSLETALRQRFGGKAKFVASGTTAALDDAVKKQYDKIEKLLESNSKVLKASYERAMNSAAAITSA